MDQRRAAAALPLVAALNQPRVSLRPPELLLPLGLAAEAAVAVGGLFLLPLLLLNLVRRRPKLRAELLPRAELLLQAARVEAVLPKPRLPRAILLPLRPLRMAHEEPLEAVEARPPEVEAAVAVELPEAVAVEEAVEAMRPRQTLLASIRPKVH